MSGVRDATRVGPTTISSAALMIARGLEHHGLEVGAVFREAGLDPDRLREPTARYPASAVQRLWQVSVRRTGDPYFGLLVARQWHPTAFHGLGYAWLASHTLDEGFQRLARYFRVLTHDSRITLEREDDRVKVELVLRNPWEIAEPATLDAAVAILTVMCRAVAGDGYAPLAVEIPRTAPNDDRPYCEFFRAPVEFFTVRLCLWLDATSFEAILPTGNQELALGAEGVVREYLEAIDAEVISARVKSVITELLPSGLVGQAGAAERLHMSQRTLQRRLEEEGTTFRELLEETRRELALRYVGQDRLSLGEITFTLGFSEPSNFSRAFRRWTGVSPKAWREGERNSRGRISRDLTR